MSTIGNTNTSYGYRDWWNENKYKDPSEWTAPPTDGTSGTTNWVVKCEEDDKAVKVEDFLNLMVAQLQNQDFMNPVDDTQYVTQLAQFATMQPENQLRHLAGGQEHHSRKIRRGGQPHQGNRRDPEGFAGG